jgi:hypothetical protein
LLDTPDGNDFRRNFGSAPLALLLRWMSHREQHRLLALGQVAPFEVRSMQKVGP